MHRSSLAFWSGILYSALIREGYTSIIYSFDLKSIDYMINVKYIIPINLPWLILIKYLVVIYYLLLMKLKKKIKINDDIQGGPTLGLVVGSEAFVLDYMIILYTFFTKEKNIKFLYTF